jgi:hypothetical protein
VSGGIRPRPVLSLIQAIGNLWVPARYVPHRLRGGWEARAPRGCPGRNEGPMPALAQKRAACLQEDPKP